MRQDWKHIDIERVRVTLNQDIQERYIKNGLYALIDPERRRVIRFSGRAAPLRSFLSDKVGLKVAYLPKARYPGGIDVSEAAWNYTILSSGMLTKEKADFDDAVMHRYQLIETKAVVVEMFTNRSQREVMSLGMGEGSHKFEIYRLKAEQAKKVLAGETSFEETYFVHSWAELREIELAQAAAEIKFQADEAAITLYQIEHLTQKYTRMVLACETINDVVRYMLMYENERFVNAQA